MSHEIIDLSEDSNIAEFYDLNTQDVWNLIGAVSDEDRQNIFKNIDTQMGGVLPVPIIHETHNKKWNATKKTLTFTLTNREFSNFFDANDTINSLFEQIYLEYILPISSNTIVQYILEHDTFDIPITSAT